MTTMQAAVFVTLLFIALAIPFIVRSIVWSRFINQMKKGNAQKALSILQSKSYKLLFSEYNQNWNILRVYISLGDYKKITRQVELMFQKPLSQRQTYQIASQTYFYFLDAQNKEWSKFLLEKIKDSNHPEEYEYDCMLYRIMIEKKSQDIETVENILAKKEKEVVKKEDSQEQIFHIGLLQYLLALQYGYQGNTAIKEKYARKARHHLKNTPYSKKAKQLITHS